LPLSSSINHKTASTFATSSYTRNLTTATHFTLVSLTLIWGNTSQPV
jgi:hypothetical protein